MSRDRWLGARFSRNVRWTLGSWNTRRKKGAILGKIETSGDTRMTRRSVLRGAQATAALVAARPCNSTESLSDLLKGAGLTDIEISDLTMLCQFASFDELWRRYLSGGASSGAYVVGLTADHREALKQRLRQDVLHGAADGSFTLQAKAWAVRGVAP